MVSGTVGAGLASPIASRFSLRDRRCFLGRLEHLFVRGKPLFVFELEVVRVLERLHFIAATGHHELVTDQSHDAVRLRRHTKVERLRDRNGRNLFDETVEEIFQHRTPHRVRELPSRARTRRATS